jgi:hypothetical protein
MARIAGSDNVTAWMGMAMLRTIAIGSCVSVQGVLVRQLSDGKIMINVDGKTLVGQPVSPVKLS